MNQKKIEEDLHSYEKRAKSENRVQRLFCGTLFREQVAPQAFSLGTTLSISVAPERGTASVSICASSRFILGVREQNAFYGNCFLLYAFAAYERSHGFLLSDGMGNLYLASMVRTRRLRNLDLGPSLLLDS